MEEFYRDQKTERENVKQNYLDRVDEIVKKLENLVQEVSESRTLKEDEDIEHTKMGQ